MKIIAVILISFILLGCQPQPKYSLYKTGEVESIEYLNGGWATSDKTIIRFTDKTTLLLKDGAYPAPWRKINVYKQTGYCNDNVYPCYKIEELK